MLCELLPDEIEAARDHLAANSTKLKSAAVAYQASIRDFADKVANAAAEVARLEDEHPDKPELVVPARDELARIRRRRAELKAPSYVDPWPECDKWLSGVATLTPAPAITLDIRKGETAAQAYERRRGVSDSVIRDITSVRAAPKPDKDRVAALKAQINALCDTSKPHVDPSDRLVVPQVSILAGKYPATVDDIGRLVAWACRDQLLKAVESLCTSGDGIAMSDDERAAKLDDLNKQLADALRQESAIATEAEKTGQIVVRRKHVHPAVVLGATINPATVFDHLRRKR